LHLYEPSGDCSKPVPTTPCSITLQLVDLKDRSKDVVFAFEQDGVATALVSPDGQQIALGDTANKLYLYSVSDSANGKFVHSGTYGNCSGGHCSWSPDSRFFASEDGNHRLALASLSGSLAIFLQEVSKASVSFAWRP
jgi:hypothetical protein